MTHGSRRVRPSVVALAITSLAFAACGRAEVDPRLVGTWQLQWAGAPMYWSIRENGTYEISGPGAGLGESGTFAAAAGRWSLRSPIRGEDGGTYEVPNDDLFVGTGKLGPGTWARVRPAAVDTPPTLQAQQSRDWPVDLPALLFGATRRARGWQSDAIPVWLEYQYVDAPNPAARGPQLRIAFVSPTTGTGMRLTLRENEERTLSSISASIGERHRCRPCSSTYRPRSARRAKTVCREPSGAHVSPCITRPAHRRFSHG